MADFKKILLEELILALGCTEPIAIALTAAYAGELAGEKPETINVYASGSVIKNANSVYVPNSGGMQGVHISAALGALIAKPELELQVLEGANDEIRKEAKKLVDEKNVILHPVKDVENLYIRVDVKTKEHLASATISKAHTRLVKKELDGKTLFLLEEKATASTEEGIDTIKDLHSILHFANTVSFEENPDLKQRMEQQIETNMAIASQGLEGEWGQQVGRTLMELAGGNIEREAIAMAAAGSDARMSGCDSPVTINSGSGNQGMTTSNPVIYYAQKTNAPHEKLLRALVLANLVSLYQKQFIGKLSAFCGAVSASAGAISGMAYLKGHGEGIIADTITNTLATSGGIVCDGAKGSCALKIATGLQNAVVGLHMAERGLVFQPGDGIVGKNVDETIRNIGRIAAEGMVSTDHTILNIMTHQANA